MRQTVPQQWAYCVAAALSLLAIPNTVPATDYYLANKPGSGSGTRDDPFGLADLPKPDNKPTRPLTVLQPGDTLWFQGGEYAFHTGPVKDVNLTRYRPAGRTATAPAADVKVHRDLAYAKPENPQLTLDVYAPADGQRLPVVVWIHGGGWHRGDKAEVDRKPQAFVDRGFVFVSINYRLFPDATIKQIAEDVAKAIRWAHDHAQDYRGDPDRIIVMGHSAGASCSAPGPASARPSRWRLTAAPSGSPPSRGTSGTSPRAG